MAFEFFFGVFGLISADSKTRHKTRLENDWRLFTPLSSNLFKDTSQQKQSATAPGSNTSSGQKPVNSVSTAAAEKGAGLFSSGGTLNASSVQSTANVENPFSSSNSSIGSSTGSISTINSSASLVKHPGSGDVLTGVDSISGRKYEFGSASFANSNQAPKSVGVGGGQILTSLSGLGVTPNMADEREREMAGPNDDGQAQQPSSSSGSAEKPRFGLRFREIYCRVVCTFLWLNALRIGSGLLVERSILTLDFYYMGSTKITFLIPALCLAIQVAAVSTIFIRNNEETNWLVPFYSSKDYLIRSRSNFRPRMKDYTRRVNISVGLALVLASISSLSLSAYVIHCSFQSDSFRTMLGLAPQGLFTQSSPAGPSTTTSAPGNITPLIISPIGNVALERLALASLMLMNILWAVYSTFICLLVSFYFNLICSIMKARFHYISKIIEDLAESNTRKTTNQARKITTLYLEHNEACELLDESNDFWQYLILFTYFTYIPAYCYCLYNLFFVDFAPWPSFITWVIHTHMGFIILLISFSAAGVSTEAHAPYTSLHTLSLIQLPLDVEVNITTFLHRVRGLTIGYSCYDLFAITNASMSNTAAACASYFLIVADFSRSSVFNNGQVNGSVAAPSDVAATSTTHAPPGLTTTPASAQSPSEGRA